IACDLVTAARDHAGLLARGFGNAVEPRNKFAHLTRAYAQLGAFIYVPAECSVDEPISINYGAAAGTAIFPYTVVVLERGARATILERIEPGSGAFVCGVSEIVTAESSQITHACIQRAPDDAHVFFTRAALPGRDSTAEWAIAELGAALSVDEVTISITNPGIDAHIASLFFPIGSQHVDLVTTADHLAGESTSGTLVKSAANGAGQGRYLGNIRIAKDAQQTVANLRDDAFLLSQRAHIDSIPALEIAANDVKAYHGATIGALDDEQLFYMTSRGIDRSSAERMIALGFFEPVIDRFPGEALRNELRTALEEKVSP
ncbi:MAG TPA: Fe-S cluster assembly protein SufD, partial [Candidatus Baltobacteraceae bacterium]|nr:Fe-S cluster assembly protein SufD [Candidatus Baltobacteraceae bacterium]